MCIEESQARIERRLDALKSRPAGWSAPSAPSRKTR